MIYTRVVYEPSFPLSPFIKSVSVWCLVFKICSDCKSCVVYSSLQVGTLWSVLYYCNWQISAKKKKQNKKKTQECEGMGVILGSGTGRDFPPSFFMGLGPDKIYFCGTGEVWKSTPVSPSNLDRAHVLQKIKKEYITNADFFMTHLMQQKWFSAAFITAWEDNMWPWTTKPVTGNKSSFHWCMVWTIFERVQKKIKKRENHL